MAERRCRGKTKAGPRCKITINLSRDGYCLMHDPKRADKAHAMQVLGGHRRRQKPENIPPAPKTMDDVVKWSSWVAHQTAKGLLDPKRAREITTALRQLTAGINIRDVQREARELRKQLKEMSKRGSKR